jgi:hypothetical protein
MAMQLSARIGVAVAFLTTATGVLGAEILTQADWQYLKSNGYKEDSYTLVITTPEQCTRLHTLINDPNMSAEKKLDAVNDYLFKSGLESGLDRTPSHTQRGPCNN